MANTESYERLSTILNSVGDAVIATDREGLITFMNPAAEIVDRLGNGRSVWKTGNGYSRYLCWKRRES